MLQLTTVHISQGSLGRREFKKKFKIVYLLSSNEGSVLCTELALNYTSSRTGKKSLSPNNLMMLLIK